MGTGKTTRANEISCNLRAKGTLVLNIDYDKVANDVVAEHYSITTPLQRQELADKLFSSIEELKQFEAVVHPKIYQKVDVIIKDFVNALPQNAAGTQIIHQIPLYNRTKSLFIQHFGKPDEVIILTATDDEIIARLTSQRGLSEEQIRARLKNQKDI